MAEKFREVFLDRTTTTAEVASVVWSPPELLPELLCVLPIGFYSKLRNNAHYFK